MSTCLIIRNNTQLWNALEYLRYEGRNGAKALIIASMYHKQITDLRDKVFYDFDFEETLLIDTSQFSGLSSSVLNKDSPVNQILRFLKKGRFTELVLGNLTDPLIYSILLRNFNNSGEVNLVAVDDGTASLDILNTRIAGTFHRKYHVKNDLNFLVEYLKNGVFPPLKPSVKNIHFFTNSKVSQSPEGDQVTANEYPLAKSVIKNSVVDQESAILIGSNIVDKEMITASDFKEAISNSIVWLKERGVKNIVYMPHRGEAHPPEFQNTADFHYTIVRNEYPLEIELLLMDKKPAYILGLFTSALLNLSQVVPADINLVSYRVSSNSIHSKGRETVNWVSKIYDTIEADAKIVVIGD